MGRRLVAVALGLLPAACAALAGLPEVPEADDAGAGDGALGTDSEPDSQTAADSRSGDEPGSDSSSGSHRDGAPSSGSDSGPTSDGSADAFDGTVLPDGPFESSDDSPSTPPSDAAPDATLDSPAQDGAPCTSVTGGLLGHWTMDANSIRGNVLQDTSGNQNHGTLVGFAPPITVPGRFGDALSFGASGSAYVLVSSLAVDTTPGASNTVSLWFERSGANLQDVLVYLPNMPRHDLWLTGSSPTMKAGTFLCFNTGQGDCVGIDDGALLGGWVHVVAVFVNGSTSLDTLYVNGAKRAVACLTGDGFTSCSGISGTAGAPVTFGGQTGFYFHGSMDDVRIYRRALTASEVSTLYDGAACP